MKLLDHLRNHSALVSTHNAHPQNNTRSGFLVNEDSIITCIPGERRRDNYYLHDEALNNPLPLRFHKCLGFADLVLLQYSLPRHPFKPAFNILTSDIIEEDDDIYAYGYRDVDNERTALDFRCRQGELHKGLPLLRAQSKTSFAIKGAIGAPVLNKRTNRICGLIYEVESSADPNIWVLPMCSIKEVYPQLAHEEKARESLVEEKIMKDYSDPDKWKGGSPERMEMLNRLALARLGGHGEYAEDMRIKYFQAYPFMNLEGPSNGQTVSVRRNQLHIVNPGVEAENTHLWKAELIAEIPQEKNLPIRLKWGMCYVNTITEATELLLDNKPSAWSSEAKYNGKNIDRITHCKDEDFSLTEAALVLMILGYNEYFRGQTDKILSNFGGVLKDKNREIFLKEFKTIRDNNPDLSPLQAAEDALRLTPFGKNRAKLGITDFEIGFYPAGEYDNPKDIYVKEAKTKSGEWQELLDACQRWKSMFP
jgi:hypothetical protein